MRFILFLLCMIPVVSFCQKAGAVSNYWHITSDHAIAWDLTKEKRLPHDENIELSGRKVSAIIYYSVSEKGELSLERDVIFPQLRTYNKAGEPDWKKYRAYFRRNANNESMPLLRIDTTTIKPSSLDSISIKGALTFYHTPSEGLQVTRRLYPSMNERFIVEQWEVKNISKAIKEIDIANFTSSQSEIGYKGTYTFEAYSEADEHINLKSQESYTFPVYFGATLNQEKKESFNYQEAEKQRAVFLQEMEDRLVLNTPDPIVNQLFYFSKIRASESIFESTEMGVIHSPGGGNYYLGTWANDQVEYSGPFFPYLGYDTGNDAAFNTYQWFKKHIPKDDSHIPYAFEMDGNFPMKHLDRGDAAMIAYGTSHYVLAKGDLPEAKQLWPLIEWSLAYCHKHRNPQGAVMSESDEMEGRIETGDANLSTSALYYGGLKYAIPLARSLGKENLARTYENRRSQMKQVINSYFAGTIEGLETYRYFDGNENLRHWICLPLVMDITEKKEATLTALFDKLWTENGVLVALNKESKKAPVFWDRATLYALRGAFKVGATDEGYQKLKDFSRKRLLGEHVPYVIEAYPENNMKHLSAESALYCRIITEGILGFEPQGFSSFQLKPSLPSSWDFLELKNIALFDGVTNISILRKKNKLLVEVTSNGESVFKSKIDNNERVLVNLK